MSSGLTPEMVTVLTLLTLLQVKHMFADFFLQTPGMLMNRALILHPGRLAHVAIHAGLSLVILIFGGTALLLSLAIAGAELIAHYLIDLTKGRYSERTGHGPQEAGYWRAFGVDQLAHQLTYVAMIWAWLIYAG